MTPSKFMHQIESISHWMIYALVLFLFGSEVVEMFTTGDITVKNILTFFIYLEIMQMVSIFFETGKIPVRYPIYISMIGLARYIILEDLKFDEAIAISGSILLLSLALVALAYRNKLVKSIGDKVDSI